MTWTSVKEQPPPLGDYVLCYFEGGFMCTCVMAQERYDNKPRWFGDFIKRMGQLPTHWMPRPTPPSSESSDA